MAFRFSLAAVLKVRENLEATEELALQKIQFEVARVHYRLDELAGKLTRVTQERETLLLKAINACRLQLIQSEIDAVKGEMASLARALESLKEQREVQMKRYRIAHSNREMLSDLRAQNKSVWEQQQARIDQKRLDDIYTSRHNRA